MKEVFVVGNNKCKRGEITIAKLPDTFPGGDITLQKDDILFHSESSAEDLFLPAIIGMNVMKTNIGILMNPGDINMEDYEGNS